MEQQGRTEVSTLGEFGLIDHLTKNNETRNASTIVSVGDDAAILDHFGKQTAVTTDMLVEGIHFDLMYTPLKHLGYKSVVVNLSDVYSMNAQPKQITVNIAFSNRYSVEALSELYEGIYAACAHYGVDLVGGDTTSSRKGLIISITAIGEVAPGKYVTRSGAKKGDLIAVSGDLGAAFLGLTILEREKKVFKETQGVQPDLENQKYIVGRLLKPVARKDIIAFFAESEIMPTAMIDVSDGLSSEILHICKQSNTGCEMYEEKIPINDQARQFAYKLELDPTACALSGGEDYELLFTLDQKDYDTVIDQADISIIGHITEAEKGTTIITKGGSRHELVAQGWNPMKDD